MDGSRVACARTRICEAQRARANDSLSHKDHGDLRRVSGRAQIEAQLTLLFECSRRSLTARQVKQTFGTQTEEDGHLFRVGMRVKGLEPMVAALADMAAVLPRQKSVGKTAGERRARDRVQRQWRYCSQRVVAPCRCHCRRPSARSSLADARLGVLGHACSRHGASKPLPQERSGILTETAQGG